MNNNSKLTNQWISGFIESPLNDGVNIRYGLYRNSEIKMNKCIIYMNGRTEWIEKNAELPELLNLPVDCGFLTWDHRGQGASGGVRAFIRSYDQYCIDAQKVIDTVIPSLPYAIVAHSMGCLIALYGNLNSYFHPKCMVLSAPLFKLRDEPLNNRLARIIASVFTTIGLGKLSSGAGSYDHALFATNKLTHDHQMFVRVCDSPYRVPSATFSWIAATFKATDFINNESNIKKLKTPILVLSPGAELIVDPKAHHAWIEKAARNVPEMAQLRSIEDARHELFSESPQYRNQAIQETNSWLKSFLSSADDKKIAQQ